MASSNSIFSAVSRRSHSHKPQDLDVQKRTLVATQLEVTSIVAGGDGLAHVLHDEERRAVFVPRGAPGDVLEAQVDFASKPARATAIRLLQPSRLRAHAPCPYVERCGGCDF